MERTEDPYVVRGSDGLWYETRYKFGRGDRVRVLRGEFGGLTGTVESLVAQMMVDGRATNEKGYHVHLDEGRLVTVRWDGVEAV